ncbi:DUF4336 domain-containing protein [Pararhizobium haloflavum]|uniref:DUF4336 domain-containing protein n=1 Tax=Pararhizobium haloflavum TaxID=2037914 RepID=UPI000C18AD95|nr:DUF4336 domain-containing protein [Pararhizobium haloflavum]
MLTELDQNIWSVDGSPVSAALGFCYPTRMVVIRLSQGGLFVWSPVALTEDLHAQIMTLGPVRHLVAPNGLHDTFIADWARVFPEARLYAAPGLIERRKDFSFEEELSDVAPDAWKGEIEQVVVRGNAIATEVIFFHRSSGTVLFTDLLQQFPRGWFSGWRAIVARLDLMLAPEPAVPRKFRLAFTDRRSARRAIEAVLAWPAKRVMMAHGTPVTADAPAYLRRAFKWLTG